MKLRHLVTLQDLNASEILHLFRTASQLKHQKATPSNRPLTGRTLGLLFQKPSIRTRVSFEVGMAQLGGQSLYIGPIELQEGKREPPKDIARVLSRYLNILVARTFQHQEVEELAQFASIPVINGLSDDSHPCQALADLFTIQEKLGRLRGVRVAYVGDGNNVCHSLLEGCALVGTHLSVAAPAGYAPDRKIVRWAQTMAAKSGARIVCLREPEEAAKGADVLYTDVWASMGQEDEREQRKRIFQPFQVNRTLMRKASTKALFMHCLPAHRG